MENAWSTQVCHSYNSMTGRISAGQRASHDGDVYRNTGSGWQSYGNGSASGTR